MDWLLASSALLALALGHALWRERAARQRLEDQARGDQLARRALADQLAATLQALPLAGAVLEVDGRVRAWNPAAEALFGWGAEILGRDGVDALSAGPNELRTTLDAAVASGKAGRTTAVLQTRAGRAFPCEWRVQPLLGALDAVTGVVVLAEDMSDRTRDERLRAVRARALELLSAAPPVDDLLLALADELADTRAGIQVAVQRVTRDDGRARLRLLGRDDAPRALVRVLDGAPLETGVGACGVAVAEARRALLYDAPGHPFCAWCADDLRALDVRTWWAEPIVSSEGQVLGVVSLFDRRDREPGAADLELVETTVQLAALALEHRRQHEALAGSRVWLRQVLDAMPQRVQVRDARGRVLLANRASARACGVDDAAELSGRSLHELRENVDETERQLALDRQVLASGEARDDDEHPQLDADGSWHQLVTSRVPFAQGDGQAVLVVSVDVTEERRREAEREGLQARVRQAQKLESLGVLAGGMAHDFNNLLVSILGNAELVARELPADASARECLDDVQAAARHAAELCRQMLAYSGRGAFVVEPVDLNAMVRDMAQLLGHALSKKTELHLALAEGLPAVMADATQLRQVVMNLITNASEALREAPGDVTLRTIVVRCGREELDALAVDPEQRLPEGRYVSLEVSDTGCGMDGPTLERIFDPFFTTKFTGRGLGLGAVQGIVRGHGGALAVRSRPGEGSTFRVLLPVIDLPVPEPEGERPVADGPRWRGRGRVLLVDDEPGVRRVAQRMLQSLGLEVLPAADGNEALALFEREHGRLDCVLLDLTMPDLDGDQVFEAMLRLDRAVPVVLCSGYDEQDVASRFGAARPAGFLEKPFELSRLVDVLSPLVDAEPVAPGG